MWVFGNKNCYWTEINRFGEFEVFLKYKKVIKINLENLIILIYF